VGAVLGGGVGGGIAHRARCSIPVEAALPFLVAAQFEFLSELCAGFPASSAVKGSFLFGKSRHFNRRVRGEKPQSSPRNSNWATATKQVFTVGLRM
jgi:hypothetical protein